jgi:membrane-associated phospholipid phosphatase
MFRRSIAGVVALVLCSTPLLAQTRPTSATLPTPPGVAAGEPVAPPGGSVFRDAAADASRARDAGEVMPSFASLFKDLGRDFRNLPSRESALILGVAGAASAGVETQDRRITRAAAGSQPLDTMFEVGGVLGGGAVQVGAAFATFAIGHAVHSPRVATIGSELVRAQIVNAAMTQGLKFSVGRTRPDGTRYSFPSGHTSATFATAAVLQRNLGWKVGIPAYGVAAYVAGSRLQENRHYLSDVLFGAAVGLVAGRTVTFGHGHKRFALAPIAAPGGGGGGVGVTLLSPR